MEVYTEPPVYQKPLCARMTDKAEQAAVSVRKMRRPSVYVLKPAAAKSCRRWIPAYANSLDFFRIFWYFIFDKKGIKKDACDGYTVLSAIFKTGILKEFKMKNLLKKFKLNKKNSSASTVESLTYQNKFYEQALYWKAHVGTTYFTL